MSSFTCDDVAPHIELFASGECAEQLRGAVEQHVAGCPACKQKVEDALQLVGLLDLHFQESERLQRLQERLAGEERRPRILRHWKIAAVAASLLLAVGLFGWFAGRTPHGGSGSVQTTAPTERGTIEVVWASPDAQWKATGSGKIEVTAGEVWLRSTPAMLPVEVATPVAVATARGNTFCIDVRHARHAGPEGREPMQLRTMVAVTVLTGLVTLSNDLGSVTGSRGERLLAEEKGAPVKQVEKLALRFAKHYQPVKVKGEAKVPAYTLPLDLGHVANFDEAAGKLKLPKDEPLLKANGFAVLPGRYGDDIVSPYLYLKNNNVPIFVTADTLLHLYHVQFDETLRDIEEREFYPDIVALTQTLVNQLAAQKEPGNVDLADAQRKALTYLTIALKALKPEAALPPQVSAKDVNEVLAEMQKHAGYYGGRDWSLFRYKEDFSQYVPRGHYTRSEELKKYFVAMMWYGRMTFLIKGSPDNGRGDQEALVTATEARQQTLAAALITRLLDQAELPDKRKARDVWERIYAVTSFYVGLADDLGMEEYRAALTKVCGASLDLAQLADAKKFHELQLELARLAPPAIYSLTGNVATFDPNAGPEKLFEVLNKTQGFRLMGQRFVPDSYMMGKLVFPTVGPPSRAGMFTYVMSGLGPIRGFPRGLDVMAVLGSNRAREIVRELGDDAYRSGPRALSYEQALDAMKKEYGGLSDQDWNRNLYWSWLYSLKPLLAEYGAGYPTFMTTKAYRTKSLNTALASWSQLRHDTILYAKQSGTMVGSGIPPKPKPVEGYVEPIPDLYGRLLALSRMTNRGLSEMKVLSPAAQKRLDSFEKILERLLAITEKELASQELTESDYDFIRNFGSNLKHVVVAPHNTGPQAAPPDPFSTTTNEMKTSIIADVHTDANTEQVLEEGTGNVELGVFVYKQPDGRLVLGAGPVLTYYEFKHPMKDRLTDEKWREMLWKNSPPQPEWTKEYRSAQGK